MKEGNKKDRMKNKKNINEMENAYNAEKCNRPGKVISGLYTLSNKISEDKIFMGQNLSTDKISNISFIFQQFFCEKIF